MIPIWYQLIPCACVFGGTDGSWRSLKNLPGHRHWAPSIFRFLVLLAWGIVAWDLPPSCGLKKWAQTPPSGITLRENLFHQDGIQFCQILLKTSSSSSTHVWSLKHGPTGAPPGFFDEPLPRRHGPVSARHRWNDAFGVSRRGWGWRCEASPLNPQMLISTGVHTHDLAPIPPVFRGSTKTWKL